MAIANEFSQAIISHGVAAKALEKSAARNASAATQPAIAPRAADHFAHDVFAKTTLGAMDVVFFPLTVAEGLTNGLTHADATSKFNIDLMAANPIYAKAKSFGTWLRQLFT